MEFDINSSIGVGSSGLMPCCMPVVVKENFQGNQNFRSHQKKRKTENGHDSENQVEKPIIYPIDDLLLKPSADDPNYADRLSPYTEFHVPMDCVGDLRMVWNFFTSFGRLQIFVVALMAILS